MIVTRHTKELQDAQSDYGISGARIDAGLQDNGAGLNLNDKGNTAESSRVWAGLEDTLESVIDGQLHEESADSMRMAGMADA